MYCLNDFEESLRRVILSSPPVHVLKAWGYASSGGPDVCCYQDWSGGFLMELADGRTAYLSGWCDYTGWGCQDGASVIYSDEPGFAIPSDHFIQNDADIQWVQWDLDPADLNKWITEGMVPWEERP